MTSIYGDAIHTNHSAKSLRRAQNARAYAKTHCRRTRTNTLHVFTPLPAGLVVLAATPLPETSSLFHQALEDPGAIDESDLPQWDAWPPYNYTPPPDTSAESRFTKNLEEVMHGRRLRLEREVHTERARRYNAGKAARAALANEIQEDLRALIGNWITLQEVIVSLPANTCERHRVMAASLLQWQARAAHALHREGELWRVGSNPYQNVDIQ